MSNGNLDAELLAWWRMVFTHEAGHAVASIVRWGYTAPITAQNPAGGKRKATFKYNYDVNDLAKNPLDQVVRSAAGGVAEKVLLGIESQGMGKDMAQIDMSVPLVAAIGKEAGELCRAVMGAERQAGFPETTKLVEEYRRAIDAIALEAHARLTTGHPAWVAGQFDEVVILTAEEVRELFDANPPAPAAGDVRELHGGASPPSEPGGPQGA